MRQPHLGCGGTTIWASALGDPTNFYVYDGLSTDSYAVAVGTDGAFTGCVAYGSTVLFWKEDCVHKVLGNYPAQYEIYTYTVPGVQEGSEKSLCIINETLFYKGRSGVTPTPAERRSLSARTLGPGASTMLWPGQTESATTSPCGTARETGTSMCSTRCGACGCGRTGPTQQTLPLLDGVLYYLDGGTGKLMKTGQDYSEEGRIPWSATPLQDGRDHPRTEGLLKLYLRADLEAGSWLKTEISVDDGPFRQVFATHNEAGQDPANPHPAGAVRQLPHPAVRQRPMSYQEPSP